LGQVITRRHIFYVAGNDPRGVDSYYRLFQRELLRFEKVSSVEASVSELHIEADKPNAHWSVTAQNAQWHVTTTYDFLRWDDLIAANMKRPMWQRYLLAFICFFKNLADGTIARIFLASWQCGLLYIYPTIGLILTLVGPLALGWCVAHLASDFAGLAGWWPLIAGCIAAAVSFPIAVRIANKAFVAQLTEARLWYDDWACRRRPDYIERTDTFARQIIAKTRAGNVDEVLIIGHSGGGAVALLVLARALEIDPTFALAVPHAALATLGSLLPITALHRHADQTREAIRRVASEPSVTWVDIQARPDPMNFYRFDPIRDVGLNVDKQCNPMIWRFSMKDLVSPERYQRLRWNFFRMHFQFIMANDRPVWYDYFMMVCGPMSLADRARPASILVAKPVSAEGLEQQLAPINPAVDRYANP
jgi:pimeloyl-ACP methyl ester carboxylesterase